MRPLQAGIYPIQFQIVDAQNGQPTSCLSELNYVVNTSAEPRIQLTANGQENTLSSPLPSGARAFIRLAAINVLSCQLARDGVPLNGSGIFTEFMTEPLLHSGAEIAPRNFVFTATCTVNSGAPITKNLTVPVNPPASIALLADGVAGPSKAVVSGGAFTLSWTARFVTACRLNDGNREFSVDPVASLRVENILTSSVLRVMCQRPGQEDLQAQLEVLVVTPSAQLALQGTNERAVSVRMGTAVTFLWQTQFTSSCQFGTETAMAPVPPAGSQAVTPPRGQHLFSLRCLGPDGRALAVSSIAISVLDPQVGLTINNVSGPNYQLPSGSALAVAWTSQDVTACRDPFGGNLPTGNQSFPAGTLATNRAYTVSCDTIFGNTITVTISVSVGGWYQADNEACSMVCSRLGKVNSPSPEGMLCVSGENRATSAVGVINYTRGCWIDCTPNNTTGSTSVGGSCYHPSQKRDWDRTDRTMGCFCT